MLVAAFAAFALLFGAREASAQGGFSDDMYSTPTGNFVNSADANIILVNQVANLKAVLATFTPGTNAYKTMERAVIYYDLMRADIESGKDIPESIITALRNISTDVYGGGAATKAELMGLRTDAIDILSQ